MGKTLGGNAGPVTCFRGAGALGSAAEQSFDERDQMIQIFAEKSLACSAAVPALPAKFSAKRAGLLAKRAGSLAKSVGNIIYVFTKIAFAERLVDLAGNSLRRRAGG